MDTPEQIRTQMAQLHADNEHFINNLGASNLATSNILKNHARALDLASQLAEISSSKFEQQMRELIGIAEAQRLLAQKLERQTDTLIDLTRALKTFTVILLIFTVGLFILTVILIVKEGHRTSVPRASLTHERALAASKSDSDFLRLSSLGPGLESQSISASSNL